MQVLHEDMATRLFSPRVWRGLAPPTALGPYGGGYVTSSGNQAFGFFDDFLFHDTTTGDGYGKLLANSPTIAQVSSTAGAPGVLSIDWNADNEEAVLQGGNILDVGPYRFQKDLAFECRVKVDAEAIVAGDHGFFFGMANGGASGAATTGVLFTGSDVLGATDVVGFQHLKGETTALDAVYLVSGGTVIDGSQNTDLDTVHTLVAATYVKLGFRFRATRPRKLEWYVDGVLQASIGETAIAAAAFPDADADFMQPTIGARGADATAAQIQVDWWAAAQYE